MSGALELCDFSSLVEQARGLELEMQPGEELQGMGGTVVPEGAGGSQKKSFGGRSEFKGPQNSFKSRFTKP